MVSGFDETTKLSEHARVSGALEGNDYRRLLRATETDREAVVVRLAGEAGLRPAEIGRLSTGDVESAEFEGTTHHVARLEGAGEPRLAYLPPDLEAALRAYGSATDREDGEPLVGVSARRIQMIVSDVADRAAADFDRPALRSVSTRDLRRYHARSLLDRGVNPRVVSEITAWSRFEPLMELFDPPDERTVVEALDGTVSSDGSETLAGEGRSTPPTGGSDGRRFHDLVDLVVRLGASLATASTREAIEREACSTLAARYEYAWIAGGTGTDGLRIREGSIDGSLDGLARLDEPPGTVCRTVVETGEPAVETGGGLPRDGSDAPTARIVVPIEHADTTYGVLEVGSGIEPETVADRERRVLSDLGRRLGQAVAAVERRRLLLADAVVRLSFRCTDRRAVFVRFSAAFDCSFTLTGLVPGENGSLLAFVWLEGASPDVVFQRATEADAVDSARLIRSGDDGSLLEFVVTSDSPALTLVERGGSLTELTASGGRGSLTAEFVPGVDVREVVESVKEAFPETEMVTKREVERSVQTDTEFREALDDTLTDKQRSVLRAAYLSGYFDWPRGSTAEELAESLGISSPTFHSHLRRAQRKLLDTYLDDGEP